MGSVYVHALPTLTVTPLVSSPGPPIQPAAYLGALGEQVSACPGTRCVWGTQVGSHLPSACLPLPFGLNHTRPPRRGPCPSGAVPSPPQHLAPCLHPPLREGELRLLLSLSTPLAQGLGSARTQGGAGTSCLSFWIPAGGEARGWTPAGVLTDSGPQLQGGGCQGSWAHSQAPQPCQAPGL